jgi:hypothetical protein
MDVQVRLVGVSGVADEPQDGVGCDMFGWGDTHAPALEMREQHVNAIALQHHVIAGQSRAVRLRRRHIWCPILSVDHYARTRREDGISVDGIPRRIAGQDA